MIRRSGFTLVELLMVMTIIGIVGVFVALKSPSPADATLPSQARKLASDLRHAQQLATSQGIRLCFRTGSNHYYASPYLQASSSCSTTPLSDPATGGAFSVTLQKGVTFSSGANSILVFDSLGRPSAAASYTLSSGTSTNSVSVAALTGRVSP